MSISGSSAAPSIGGRSSRGAERFLRALPDKDEDGWGESALDEDRDLVELVVEVLRLLLEPRTSGMDGDRVDLDLRLFLRMGGVVHSGLVARISGSIVLSRRMTFVCNWRLLFSESLINKISLVLTSSSRQTSAGSMWLLLGSKTTPPNRSSWWATGKSARKTAITSSAGTLERRVPWCLGWCWWPRFRGDKPPRSLILMKWAGGAPLTTTAKQSKHTKCVYKMHLNVVVAFRARDREKKTDQQQLRSSVVQRNASSSHSPGCRVPPPVSSKGFHLAMGYLCADTFLPCSFSSPTKTLD